MQNAKCKIKTPPSFGHLPYIRGGVCKEKIALQNLRMKGGASEEFKMQNAKFKMKT